MHGNQFVFQRSHYRRAVRNLMCSKDPCRSSLASQLATVTKVGCNKNLATLSDVPGSIKLAWPPSSSSILYPLGFLQIYREDPHPPTSNREAIGLLARQTPSTWSGRQGHQESALPEASVQFPQEGLLKWGVRPGKSQTGFCSYLSCLGTVSLLFLQFDS